MTEKMLARVAVSSVPYAADRLYTYLVPDELIGSAEAGKRVTIPFGRGNRRVEGFLLEVGREAATSPLKPIDAVLDDAPLLDAKDIRLERWMKARYFCTYYDAIKTILPGGVWLQYRELWHVNGEISAEDALSSVAPDSLEETLLRAMLSAKEIDRGALDELGGEKTAKALRSLEACGLAVRETKLRQRLQDKSVRMVSLCVSAEDALAAVEPKRRSAPVRYAVVELLSREGCLSSSEISYYTGATMQTLRGLKKAGLVEFSEREVLRVSRYDDAPAREDIVLNGEQQAAFDGLCTLLGREGGSAALLHGAKRRLYRLRVEILLVVRLYAVVNHAHNKLLLLRLRQHIVYAVFFKQLCVYAGFHRAVGRKQGHLYMPAALYFLRSKAQHVQYGAFGGRLYGGVKIVRRVAGHKQYVSARVLKPLRRRLQLVRGIRPQSQYGGRAVGYAGIGVYYNVDML